MSDIEKENLYERNNKIINALMKEAQDKCPGAIDLIGIGGSFCSGDIYEKSDLDLVIITNSDCAKCLDKCFIIDDVGFDIYTQGWDNFEEMAKYTHPFVTKLFDLDIIYSKNEEVIKRYKSLQKILVFNMKNSEYVDKQIGVHFSKVLGIVNSLQNVFDIGTSYKKLANIIKEIEFILFLVNRTYIKRGTKRIPEEIGSLKILPPGFLSIYSEIIKDKTLKEIKTKVLILIKQIKELLDSMNITYELNETTENITTKKDITVKDLIGTYEEIYSNWKNKMYHAIDINSPYLSFITMSACQEFYDEMNTIFNIPTIELLANYNPDNLKENATAFDTALNEWKKLYDMFGLNIQSYPNIKRI